MIKEIKLFCIINGESTPFSIKIRADETVDDLKKAIKKEKPIQFSDVDSDNLNIWRVSISIVDDDEDKPIRLEDQSYSKKLHATSELFEVFSKNPLKKTIHAIIEKPLRDVCSPQSLARHQPLERRTTELLDRIKALENTVKKVDLNVQTTLHNTQQILQRTDAILTQTYELLEYPIPRLFIVVPDHDSKWKRAELLEKTYRLYFLCECDQLHFALHEGYIIKQPSKFFRQYGGYLKTMIAIAKNAAVVAGFVVPQVAHLANISIPDCFTNKGNWDTFKNRLDWMDQKLENFVASQQRLVKGSQSTFKSQQSLDRLEGASLRELEGYLNKSDESKKLGNLYRVTTNEGNVKWVCLEHFDKNHNYKQAQSVKRVVESVGGTFDINSGKATFRNISRQSFTDVFKVMKKGGVQELIIHQVSMDIEDVKLLAATCNSSNIQILELDRLDIINFSLLTRKIGVVKMLLDSKSIKSVKSKMIPAKAVAAALKSNTTLTTFNLSANKLGAKDSKAIAEALKINTTLTTIDLQRNNIRSEGGKAIAEALKVNTTLTTIDLHYDNIGPLGGKAIAEALKVNTTLTAINLKDNHIGSEGGKAIVEALKINTTLTAFDLSANKLDDEGGKAMGEALKVNTALTTIDLKYNRIGSE
ncbi:hypothetical protein BGZ49_002222, partial [Haplosporangium sp. Z 27]